MRIEGTEADLCLKCMGMWFEPGELARASGLKISETATGRALADAKRTPYRCPSCAVPLYERELDPGSGIIIDQCPRCSGLFLDRDEFGRAQRHFRAKGAPRLKRQAAPAAPREEEPVEVDDDFVPLAVFQYLTGLPVEVGIPQTLFPPAVMTVLIVNVVLFVAAAVAGLDGWIKLLGLVPADVVVGRHLWTFVTSMFMHGGVLHIIGNSYFLYIAGDNVEERLGWLKFLGFYLVCGLVAGLAHVVGSPGSTTPAVGASGAISGVLGAYLVFFPHTRFLMRWLCRWGFIIRTLKFEVPAYGYLVLWLLLQLLFASLGTEGVAWWAHVGGFACGVGIACYVRWREMQTQPQRNPIH